jgi:hypothetical protein
VIKVHWLLENYPLKQIRSSRTCLIYRITISQPWPTASVLRFFVFMGILITQLSDYFLVSNILYYIVNDPKKYDFCEVQNGL